MFCKILHKITIYNLFSHYKSIYFYDNTYRKKRCCAIIVKKTPKKWHYVFFDISSHIKL